MKPLLCLWICLAPALFSCSAKHSVLEREVAELKDKITILQSERNQLEERIAALEAQRVNAVRRSEPPNTISRPPLKVVRLEPESEHPLTSEPPPQPAATPESTRADRETSAVRSVIRGSGNDLSLEEGAKVE